jgi:hypothetical protein
MSTIEINRIECFYSGFDSNNIGNVIITNLRYKSLSEFELVIRDACGEELNRFKQSNFCPGDETTPIQLSKDLEIPFPYKIFLTWEDESKSKESLEFTIVDSKLIFRMNG